MNVLEVYSSFLPKHGGVQRHIYDLCRCMIEKGHTPIVLTWRPTSPSFDMIDGIIVNRILMPRLLSLARYPLVFLLSLKIAYLAHKYNIDIIHAHGYIIGLASALASVFRPTPPVMTLHVPIQNTNAYLPSFLIPSSIFEKALKKFFVTKVTVIICVSKFVFRETRRLGFPSAKLKVIYNWMTPMLKSNIINLNSMLERFNLLGRPFILAVGRLEDRQKGFSMLMSALRLLRDRHYDIDLVIVGDGPDKAMLQRFAVKSQVDDLCHFLGSVSDLELAYLYKGCEIFVLPSRGEGFGLTLLEAASFEKPIVATNVGAVPEIIEDGYSGILSSPSPKSLASGIELLLLNPSLKNALAKNSLEIVKKFSKQNCDTTIKLLECITKRKRARLR